MTWSSERADADFAAAKHGSGFTVADDQTSLFIDVFRKGIVSPMTVTDSNLSADDAGAIPICLHVGWIIQMREAVFHMSQQSARERIHGRRDHAEISDGGGLVVFHVRERLREDIDAEADDGGLQRVLLAASLAQDARQFPRLDDQIIDPFDLSVQAAAFQDGALQRQGAERGEPSQLFTGKGLFQQYGEIQAVILCRMKGASVPSSSCALFPGDQHAVGGQVGGVFLEPCVGRAN